MSETAPSDCAPADPPNGGALVITAWPQTAVRPTGLWCDRVFGFLGLRLPSGRYRLGHAGCLLVSAVTRRAHYFDCGRYECPPQMCRVRGAVHDPELTLTVRARFAADGSLANADELLLELAANPATHGDGVMLAAVMDGLQFEAACQRATVLQQRVHRFRHFAGNSMNCTRFILRMTAFARASLAVRALEAGSLLLGPGTLFLVRLASPTTPLFMVEHGTLSRWPPWSRALDDRPPDLCAAAFERCSGPVAPARRAADVPPEARWLSGTAVGKWIALTQEPGLGPCELRFRRWSDQGTLDCDRVFTMGEEAGFDPARPFEPGYPTTCEQCTVHQNGRTTHLRLSCALDRKGVDEMRSFVPL